MVFDLVFDDEVDDFSWDVYCFDDGFAFDVGDDFRKRFGLCEDFILRSVFRDIHFSAELAVDLDNDMGGILLEL